MPAWQLQNTPSTRKSTPGLKRPRDLLQLFFIYRLLLSGILSILFFNGLPPALLGSHNPELFSFIAVTYSGLVLASGLFLFLHLLSDDHQTDIAVFVDIAAITLLMYASGGVKTGLGMLLAVSIAAGSLAIRRHTALLFAALATLAILAEQVYSHLRHDFPATAYTQAGLLGASFFAMAILADVLSKRLLESEQLASQRELDLANMAQLNEYIIQRMQTGIIIVDEKEQTRLNNEAALNLLGIPDTAGAQPLEQTCPALLSQLKEWKRNPSHERLAFRSTAGGRDLHANFIQLGGKARIGALIFLEDSALVTEQLQQMKLASLGRLTASIAHEIRNPLGAISHAGQLLEESPQLEGGDKRLTEIIRSNSERMNQIIENVLQLSRRNRAQPQQVELKPLLEELADEIRQENRLAPETLKVKIDPADTRIRVDPSQIRQVLVSLIDNAMCHFHQDINTLRLRIEGGVTADSGGPFIDVIDNGPGIDPETAKQIFEPFFTTRSTGTGLGLYIAKELSESNRARLEYIPGPGGGSCFHISFPSLRKKVFNS